MAKWVLSVGLFFFVVVESEKFFLQFIDPQIYHSISLDKQVYKPGETPIVTIDIERKRLCRSTFNRFIEDSTEAVIWRGDNKQGSVFLGRKKIPNKVEDFPVLPEGKYCLSTQGFQDCYDGTHGTIAPKACFEVRK